MSSQDSKNKEGLSNYTMDSFEGSIINLEEIFQFKIGAELEEFSFNFNYIDESEELKESKHELITEIVSELIGEVCSKLPEDACKEHIVIDNMTLQEILEKLRCKCDEMKDKLRNKYREYDVVETHSEDDDAGREEKKDVSIDSGSGEDETDENKSMDEAGDADISESIDSDLQDDESVDLNEYLDIREYAIQFVNKIVNKAKIICAGSAKYYSLNNKKQVWDPRKSAKYYSNVTQTDESSDEEEKDYRNPKLAIRDFKLELGKIVINNYIKTWHMTKDWRYKIAYRSMYTDSCCDFYEYEVCIM